MMPVRPVPESLNGAEMWNDVPAKISRAMGGGQFFFELGAGAIHRIGISNGLGWRLPRHEQRKDGIDYIQVFVAGSGGTLHMSFLHAGERPPQEAELVKEVGGLSYAELLPTYEREMNVATN